MQALRSSGQTLQGRDQALVNLGNRLGQCGYAHITVTPETHRLTEERAGHPEAESLADVLGRSRLFRPGRFPDWLIDGLEKAGELEERGGLLRSRVRFSTLGESLYVHSAHPTAASDAVFFGPDTYRFARLISQAMEGWGGAPIERVLDIGCGSGAGGLFLLEGLAKRRVQAGIPVRAPHLFLSDVNVRALRFARVNAALAGAQRVSLLLGDVLAPVKESMDVILSNPPYLVDPEARLYRNGGGTDGCGLSIRITKESLERLRPGGLFILYTGTPVMGGRHALRDALGDLLAPLHGQHTYAEIDPDVFADELRRPAYAGVERLAVVSLVVRKPGSSRVFPAGRAESREERHRRLDRWNQVRLKPTLPGDTWREEVGREWEARLLEGELVEAERRGVRSRAEAAPDSPDAFLAWFSGLASTGPGQGDPLFPWLAESASLEEMRWFLSQEIAGEAGFDDLVAMTQVKLPALPKLEMARNYWDEMGGGQARGMHGALLERTIAELRLPSTPETVWESLALSNLMIALAWNRRYAYQSIGALGAVEMTAPGRVTRVNAGLKRLGVHADARRYFSLHAGLDVRHSVAWNDRVIRPLVAAEPACARAIAEGALLRLSAGERCFARYRRELGVTPGQG